MLILRLLDSAHRDIFHRLCTDIVACASSAESEREAVEITIARTWRWHHLLRGGNDGRLSLEEQKGLIGELLVLERYLLSQMSALDAVNAWRGPLGSPKDFEIGRICIEAKARRGPATPYIAISSEHQLDESCMEQLFLHVIELDQAPSNTEDSYDISEVAGRIRNQIIDKDENVLIAFENLLSAAGFRWEDDYRDSQWVEGNCHLYRVEGQFPRITAQTVNPGVSNVKYSISLVECKPFQVADTEVKYAIGGQNGN